MVEEGKVSDSVSRDVEREVVLNSVVVLASLVFVEVGSTSFVVVARSRVDVLSEVAVRVGFALLPSSSSSFPPLSFSSFLLLSSPLLSSLLSLASLP